MTSQLVLPLADKDRAIVANARLKVARRAVADRIGHKVLAEVWDCAVTMVADKIEERDRKYLKPVESEYLELHDADGLILAAKCELAGYEMPQRKQTITADEIVRRLPGALRAVLSEELAEVVEHKVGLR